MGWGISSLGILLVAGSLALGSGWAAAGLSFGTGLALAGFVLLLERHLLQAVGEALEEGAAPLVERLERLESLQEMQDRISADRTESDFALAKAVRQRPTFENVAAMLERAQEQCLFEDIRLRGGIKTQTLISLAWENFEAVLYKNYPDFDPDVLDENPEFREHILIRCFPEAQDGPSVASEWWPTQSLEEGWRDFLDACEKMQVSTADLNIGHLIEALASSYVTMAEGRRSPANHPERLQGSLIMLVNPEWAITTAGLESRKMSLCLPHHLALVGNCPEGHDDSHWQEALTYTKQVADVWE